MVRLKQRLFAIVLAMCLVLGLGAPGISIAANNDVDYPDVFAREKTTIAAGETVGRLLVEGADTIVEGNITDGIIIVDGNLVIKEGAVVKGTVLVIGGYADFLPGTKLEEDVWVIPPQGFSLAPMVVGALIVLGTLSLVTLPAAIWLITKLLKRLPIYGKVWAFLLKVQHHWPALYIAGTLLISGIMLAIFVELAWATIFQKTTDVFDNVMIWLVRYFASPALDRVMIFITDLGYGLPYFVVVVTVFSLIAYLKRWLEAEALAICLAGGAFLNYLLKHLFERTRPDLFRVVEAAGYSFPSGHAMISLCFYGMVAFLIVRNIQNKPGRILVISGFSLLIAAIGVSRIYLGAHYPTDVVAGFAAGSMWLAFCISLLMWWEKKKEGGWDQG